MHEPGQSIVLKDRQAQVFARDVFNASLTLMSILVVVITFLAVEYKDARHYAPVGAPIHNAIVGTTVASVWAGVLALVSLYKLRPERGSTALLALAFGLLIAAMMVGILYFGFSLIA